jgi:hypothetical protein
MRSIRSITILATLAATLLMPAVASATTVDECQAAITSLAAQTEAATFIGKNAAKEVAGLVRTLAGASETLAAGKLDNTVTKLTDYRLHAEKLGQDGKLDATDAAALLQSTDAAIACVQSIGA